MAGTIKRVGSVSGVSIDTTLNTDTENPSGGHASVSVIVNVTAITGTWTITARWGPTRSGNKIDLATQAGITITGLRRLPLTADFNATRMAIPAPTEVFFDNTVAGSITAEVYYVYGD